MKAVRIIYIIMNSIMIAACAVLAMLKTQSPQFALYLIAPIIVGGSIYSGPYCKSQKRFQKAYDDLY